MIIAAAQRMRKKIFLSYCQRQMPFSGTDSVCPENDKDHEQECVVLFIFTPETSFFKEQFSAAECPLWNILEHVEKSNLTVLKENFPFIHSNLLSKECFKRKLEMERFSTKLQTTFQFGKRVKRSSTRMYLKCLVNSF